MAKKSLDDMVDHVGRLMADAGIETLILAHDVRTGNKIMRIVGPHGGLLASHMDAIVKALEAAIPDSEFAFHGGEDVAGPKIDPSKVS